MRSLEREKTLENYATKEDRHAAAVPGINVLHELRAAEGWLNKSAQEWRSTYHRALAGAQSSLVSDAPVKRTNSRQISGSFESDTQRDVTHACQGSL